MKIKTNIAIALIGLLLVSIVQAQTEEDKGKTRLEFTVDSKYYVPIFIVTSQFDFSGTISAGGASGSFFGGGSAGRPFIRAPAILNNVPNGWYRFQIGEGGFQRKFDVFADGGTQKWVVSNGNFWGCVTTGLLSGVAIGGAIAGASIWLSGSPLTPTESAILTLSCTAAGVGLTVWSIHLMPSAQRVQ